MESHNLTTVMTDQVHSSQRHTNGRRCVICGGSEKDPRGKGRRCYGYVSADGKFAHCSREEHAGAVDPHPKSNTYAHRLTGPCQCGTTHGTDDHEWNNIECAYDYRDEKGMLLYQVVRKVGKQFVQRRPDGAGGWIWSVHGRRVLYRLPQLLKASPDDLVFIVEGEKDAERLSARVTATTNPQGAGKWHFVDECARAALHGRHLVIIADADKPGRSHAEAVKEWARDVAATIRVIDLHSSQDNGQDVSDWLDTGHTIDELRQIAEGTEPIDTGITADPWPRDLARAVDDVSRALGENKRADRRPLFGLDAAELVDMQFPPTQWQIKGLITKGGTAVVAGEPKAGVKTWILIEGALAVATGTKMCGQFDAQEGSVAIFFAEDQAQSVRNRLRALVKGSDRQLQRGRLHLQPRGEFIDLLKDEDLAWIVASARRLPKLDLLVLDPLRDIHSAAEDKSDEMSPVMRRLRLLSDLLGGCTVWISHHTPKVSKDSAKRRPGQNMRGSSAIHGSIDSGIYVEPLEADGVSVFKASVTSQIKSGRSAGTFEIEMSITDDSNGEAIKAGWSYSKEAAKHGPDKKRADDDVVFAFVRELAIKGTSLNRTALREHDERPIAEKRFRDSLERLLESKRLIVSNGVVNVPRTAEGSRGY